MITWLNNRSTRKLEKEHDRKYAEAIRAQRNGNIRLFSKLIAEAEKIMNEIELQKEKEKA